MITPILLILHKWILLRVGLAFCSAESNLREDFSTQMITGSLLPCCSELMGTWGDLIEYGHWSEHWTELLGA